MVLIERQDIHQLRRVSHYRMTWLGFPFVLALGPARS
jgi:hypothetical protein